MVQYGKYKRGITGIKQILIIFTEENVDWQLVHLAEPQKVAAQF